MATTSKMRGMSQTCVVSLGGWQLGTLHTETTEITITPTLEMWKYSTYYLVHIPMKNARQVD